MGTAALDRDIHSNVLLFLATRLWSIGDVRDYRLTVHLAACSPGVALNRAVVARNMRLCETTWMDTAKAVGMQDTKYLVITVPLRSVVDVGRLMNLRVLSQFVTVAAIQLVNLNPVAGGRDEAATGLLFAGSGSMPAQQPSVGVEFILPCKPGTLEPNATATPLLPRHAEECCAALRTLRDGGRHMAMSKSMCGSPVATPDNAVRRCCRDAWQRLATLKEIPVATAVLLTDVLAKGGAAFTRTVFGALGYVATTLALATLPGPAFSAPPRSQQEAADTPLPPRASKDLTVQIDRTQRAQSCVKVEVRIIFPYFSGISLEALGCMLSASMGNAVVRVGGMSGELTILLSTTLEAGTKRRRLRA